MSNDELLREIEQQRLLMIGEATGDSRGLGAEIEYAERRERIQAALRLRNLDDPNPFGALAAWRAKWRSGELPKWADRRDYVKKLTRNMAIYEGLYGEESAAGAPSR